MKIIERPNIDVEKWNSLVSETPDSAFFYYTRKPTKGEKVKDKLRVNKYNPVTRKHEIFVEKKLPPHSK